MKPRTTDSDTLFLIHGMWCGPWCWDNYRGAFEAAGYRCVTATLPFHDVEPDAAPDPRLGTASLCDYAQAMQRAIVRLTDRPIIVGHSMGGLLAQILGARGLAKALVLLTPAAPAGIVAIRPSVIRGLWRTQARWGFWRKPIRLPFADAVYAILHLLPPQEQRAVYQRGVYESGRVLFEMGYWPLDPHRASRVDASKVRCPVLVVAGARDRIIPASVVRKVARKYEATYWEYPDNAHWVLGEPGWEAIAADVIGWLGDRPGSPSAPRHQAT